VLPAVFPEHHHAGQHRIVGFAGLWLMPDEVHITTIGVSPAHRGKSLGELLLLAMVDIALEHRATWLTLEVRVSNTVAQELYRKYGMQASGVRRHYYSDNGEDAFIMSAGPLQAEPFQQRLAELRARFAERMARLEAEEVAMMRQRQ
jgi:ribosomal-protein-alanine N-acetyltransferase